MTASKRRRRLLFLAPVLPADRGNGLAMRIGFFLNAYSRQYDVDLAVFPIVSALENSSDFARKRARRMELFLRPPVDSHFSLVMAMDDPATRLEAFRRYGRPSLASFAIERARRALHDWTSGEAYDVVHVSRLYLAGVAEFWTKTGAARRPHLVVDCDENDAVAYRRVAVIERNRGRRREAVWAEAEADAFARLARETLPRFDLAFAASAAEVRSLSACTRGIALVPNVVPAGISQRRRARGGRKTVLFVGTMGYAPNDDAARWMATRIWPRVREAFKTPLRLVIAGSCPSMRVVQLGRRADVEVTGAVPDIATAYRQADIAVVPIRGGGGTRIKLLEAAAWGVPIVSTAVGAAGTTFRHRRDLLIADNAKQFARSCIALLRKPAYARELAARARRLVATEYDADRWSRRVATMVDGLDAKRNEQGA